jgi:hypothetical protein
MPKGHRDATVMDNRVAVVPYSTSQTQPFISTFSVSLPNRTVKVNDVVHHMQKATVFSDMRCPTWRLRFVYDGP